MKEIKFSTQYKKDAKRYRHRPELMSEVTKILQYLKEDKPIPAEYYPHPLHHDYKGCMECHVKDDFLLIWIDRENDVIGVLRLGTHSELFGKGAKR